MSQSYLLMSAGLLGLLIGPLLTWLAFSVPARLDREWHDQAREVLELEPMIFSAKGETASRAFLLGMSVLSGLLTTLVVSKFGMSVQSISLSLLTWILLVACAIDLRHKILPDQLIQPLMWLGLIVNSYTIFCSLEDAFYGAVGGYLSFWIIGRSFEWLTGRVGLGDGDFKLIAVFGAWMGWQALPSIILTASIIGLVIGVIYLRLKQDDQDLSFPFGPAIAIGGFWYVLNGSLVSWLIPVA
jgi:leader peptidase (prepilin peptidase)/N-methyltransferase